MTSDDAARNTAKTGKRGHDDDSQVIAMLAKMDSKLNTFTNKFASLESRLADMDERLSGQLGSVKKEIEAVKKAQLVDRDTLSLMQKQVADVRKGLDGSYRTHPFTTLRKLTQRFSNVKSFNATGVSLTEQIKDTVAWLVRIFADHGVHLPDTIFSNVYLQRYSAAAVRKNPALADKQMVVVTLPDIKYLGVMRGAAKQIFDKHGVFWNMELTREELAAQKRIKQSPLFQKACGKLPKDQKPLWLFDRAILGRGPDARVWTVESVEERERAQQPEAMEIQ